ncbi:MAG: dipeptidase, partial [Alistipes sp.]|nr:dipeptidase [Alistipes sp.]
APNAKKKAKIAPKYTLNRAQQLFDKWVELDKYLMIKYIDGNVKSDDNNGFIDNGNGKDIPGKIEQPGYSEKWKRAVAADNGKILEVVK